MTNQFKEQTEDWLNRLRASFIPNEKIEIISEIIESFLEMFGKAPNAAAYPFSGLYTVPSVDKKLKMVIIPTSFRSFRNTGSGIEIIHYVETGDQKPRIVLTGYPIKKLLKITPLDSFVLLNNDCAVNIDEIKSINPRLKQITLLDDSVWTLTPYHWRKWRRTERGVFRNL